MDVRSTYCLIVQTNYMIIPFIIDFVILRKINKQYQLLREQFSNKHHLHSNGFILAYWD